MPHKNETKRKQYQKQYHQTYRRKNLDAFYEQKRERRTTVVRWYLDFKKTLQCSRCAENHPSCLDFHHTTPADKLFAICTAAYAGFAIDTIKAEIAKCIVLCANCHRKQHFIPV